MIAGRVLQLVPRRGQSMAADGLPRLGGVSPLYMWVDLHDAVSGEG
jgi:hypothetical protein